VPTIPRSSLMINNGGENNVRALILKKGDAASHEAFSLGH